MKLIFIPQTARGKAYLIAYLLFVIGRNVYEFSKGTDNQLPFLEKVGTVILVSVAMYAMICVGRMILMKGDYIQKSPASE